MRKTLTQAQLKSSKNNRIKELAQNEFFIFPDSSGSLIRDIIGGVVRVSINKVFYDKTNVLVGLSPSENNLLDEEKANLNLERAFTQYYGVEEGLKHYESVKLAWRQRITGITSDTLIEGFSATTTKEIPKIIPSRHMATLLFPDNSLVVEEGCFTFASIEKELFKIKGKTVVNLQLTDISKEPERYQRYLQYKIDLLREISIKTKRMHDKHLTYDEARTQVLAEPKPAVRTLLFQLADKQSYPQWLYRVVSIETTSKYLAEAIMKKKLPNHTLPCYETEVAYTMTLPARVYNLTTLYTYYNAQFQGDLFKQIYRVAASKQVKLPRDLSPHTIVEAPFPSAIYDLVNGDSQLQDAVKLYSSTRHLLNILKTDKPDAEKLNVFDREYKRHEEIVFKNHQDFSVKALCKATINIIFLGLPVLFGLWKTKGSELAEETNSILKRTFSPTEKILVKI